ncbi:mitochondrial sodium/calcium exchanger protein isoform X1 [Drosophila santomea]|uniref:mitochondrial sodium/calcium exchanger protein isoform X1 n=1 Tax=Drosophila santomea TaxID=129105 RepID=UPI001CCA3EE3|nr:mitochondrial sodium/calcium exchanger protein isoform X1 [Drosophila santomea]
MREETTCSMVHDLLESQKCNFVRKTSDCLINMNLFNYLAWHYCKVDVRNSFNSFWSVLGMFLIAIYVFWMMQITIKNYFCPTLMVIADFLRMNESTAGVTVLAVASGSPDFFTAIASRMQGSKYSFLACMSQTMFLHFFVAGLVILTKPFHMQPNTYLRDFGFLFLNTVYMDYIHKRPQGISWVAALPSALIFVGYVVVTIVDQYLLIARIQKMEQRQLNVTEALQLEELKPQKELPLTRPQIDRSSIGHGSRNKRLFRQFWNTVTEFDKDRFQRGTLLVKLYLIVKQPIDMLLRLLVPKVDMNAPLYGWSKLLFNMQVLLVPTYMAYIILRGYSVAGVAVYMIVLITMVPVAIMIFFLTRTDTPPMFFRFTSSMGFLAAVFLIFCLTTEVNAMFFTMATVLKVSQEFSLTTAICWALSSNDLVANLSLSHQGWPRMAMTATFSAPVFGSFVFLAMPLVVNSFIEAPGNIFPSEGRFGETVCIFLEVGMGFSMLSVLTTNFKLRRACGFLLVTYYIFFLGVLILLEKGVIHAYGV